MDEITENLMKLKSVSKKSDPAKYSELHAQTGFGYNRLSLIRDKEANLKSAIQHLKEALNVLTKETYPVEYAKIQNNLGFAYYWISGVVWGKEKNLNLAIQALKEALTVYKKERQRISIVLRAPNKTDYCIDKMYLQLTKVGGVTKSIAQQFQQQYYFTEKVSCNKNLLNGTVTTI